MNDRASLVHPSDNRPSAATPQDPTTTEENQTSYKHFMQGGWDKQCPQTIGIDEEEGTIGVLGVEWLRDKTAGGKKYQVCALVLGEMLRKSIELKRDHVPLSWAWLNGLLGDEETRTILPYLQFIGAIRAAGERGKWYQLKPNKYRFTEEYSHQPLGVMVLDEKHIRRYRKYRKQRLQKAISSAPINKMLWEDLQHLSIHPSWTDAMPSFTEGQWRKEWAWLRSHEAITNQDIYFHCTVSEAQAYPGRIYSTFCNTPSVLRSYALLDGEPLVCIDVKASQPFLHSTLIPESEEKRRYLKSVYSGNFYEDIGKAGNWEGESREKLKAAVFTSVFYGRTIPVEKDPIWEAFTSLYPMLAEAITNEKREHYSKLAVKMQYLEAEIILHTALPALKARVPECRVLTVHDAIYVRKEHVLDATREMVYAFKKHTGHIPALKLETPPQFLCF